MNPLSTNITCAALNYQRLDEQAVTNLKNAEPADDRNAAAAFKRELGFDVDSVAIIKKCNAVMIVIAYGDDLSEDYVRGRLLHSWDTLSQGGITQVKRDIRFHDGIEALQFIAECAVGINSITVGDSQVLSQMIEGLRGGLFSPKSPFGFIADWIGAVAEECRLKTEIFKGNVSVERIASDYVTENISMNKKVILVGYGKSGKLVAKILNKENRIPITVINRSEVDLRTEGYAEDASYSSFHAFAPDKHVGAVVIAVDNTPETDTLVVDIVAKIFSNDALYVDLAMPPLLAGKVKKFVGIDQLSEIAQKTIGTRKDAVNKARKLIGQYINIIIDRINENNSAIYVREQKSSKFSVDGEKVQLIKLRGEMLRYLRESLATDGFLEVITPFIVGISTDPPKVDKGGTIDVGWLNGTRAFLRQSNQLYKQICVASGIDKMYEIGPFWRQETKESYRHLQESIGLDIEMQRPEGAEELYALACSIIKKTNDHLTSTCGISKHLSIPDVKKIPILTYQEAVDLLRENGNPVTRGDDFGLVSEAKLGQLIKKKYGCDILVIKDYPDTIKKFYTKQKPDGLTETFDVIVDGWELVSGAVRQTDGNLIRKSMRLSDINAADYEFYISMVDGAVEHGGFCLGLDRLLAKILDKEMVSDAVPFPRTYRKLIP
jgi:aspartyl/asparaginyl-tRNA synthetase